MLPDDRFNLENSARRRQQSARRKRTRFTPPDWPHSRGPVPNPRRDH
ncbi:hypothetical protein [Actinoplanes solisilvae]|nr:hypothetical protein [Actinoplanes solisilvae]